MFRSVAASVRARASRVLGVIGVSLLLSSGAVVFATPSTPARAAEAGQFDPSYLISDFAFFNNASMSEREIQRFLESSSGGCLNTNCLAVYRESTSTRATTARCARYEGATGESAARIIYKVQVACGVSAKALLVTLQKEQSLVTAKAPSDGRIRIAMGYGCPDTSACDSLYYGFFNQLYSAASQFQRYAQSPTSFRHAAGRSTDVYLHPNSWIPNPPTCGTVRLTIRNQATAGLYNYTPYTPNAAAMANLYGTGDACSSYGNRNFWRFYTDWFGNPTASVGFSDVPPSAPFYREITWLGYRGVSTGYGDGSFRPLEAVNRDAMAAFLYRFAGSPSFVPPAVSPFSDVPVGSPFYREITWLHASGISTGYSDGTFRPLSPVARDAMAAFLHRLAGSPPHVAPTTTPFVDMPVDSQFYKEITWLASAGITTGYDDGTFRPLVSVERGAMAAFMNRLWFLYPPS